MFGVLSAALLAAVVVLGLGAFTAQRELTSALPIIGTVQKQFQTQDTAGLATSTAELAAHARKAHDATDSLVWHAAEALPFVGETFHAIGAAAGAADSLADGALVPLSRVDLASLRPTDGRFDLATLSSYIPEVQHAAGAFRAARAELDSVDTDRVLGRVAGPIEQIRSIVNDVEPAMSRVGRIMPALPDALGASGPRTYLLVSQNNAEARGAGGVTSALTLITADAGRITITAQASSSDFENNRAEPIVPLDPAVVGLYTDKVARFVQDMTSMPDFAESATIARAYWTDRFGGKVDAVLSVDPIALSYIIGSTGPVTLPDGTELTADNAVKVLLSDVYAKYPDNAEQDEYFAAAASSVFDKIASGSFDLVGFADAIGRAAAERRILYAPDDATQEAALAGLPVLGELPADNAQQTAVGVYINDLTMAKLSYYTDMAITATADTCQATPTYTTMLTFANTLDRKTSKTLPRYVNTGRRFPKGTIGTDIMFYGPVGAKLVSAWYDGTSIAASSIDHLGRPAIRLNIINKPGQSHIMSVVFAGGSAPEGELVVDHTPMVRDTPVAIEHATC
ncbi:DUF4012 domain-containing protein [Galbitalea sp. SE-J8]|uniref:DUF4012 domain-containing protein n=1 Tax=Galbitalea sp. SE-J8 TaxID=3054952 RepID=UPI00259C7FF9|nr:DUF4012 domain-containing protein [Galbitalea sp. SE-J8]MDM4761503.1 DUF4012 domain-containing protein [Galbitalea sp. SE-J8]